MTVRDAPPLVRYVSETRLRILGQRWKLDKYFSGQTGQGYVEWIRREEDSLESLYGYRPTASQLKRSVAAAIQDEEKFLGYLSKEGGTRILDEDEELEKLARVAACIVVGLYCDGAASASTDIRSVSRGS